MSCSGVFGSITSTRASLRVVALGRSVYACQLMTDEEAHHRRDEPGVSLSAPEALVLLDWKRRVAELYHEVRAAPEPTQAWDRWREGRDLLFATHPRSPIPPSGRADFDGLAYFDYDPAARVLAQVADTGTRRHQLSMSGGGTHLVTRFATASFELYGSAFGLELYWLGDFRGGLFLPFRDATNGEGTYAGGRYLLDTLKGEDLGTENGLLILDFNFAYHPPCLYNEQWSCPLAPPANRLPVAVHAGERQSD